MKLFLLLIGMVFVVEGLPYVVAPEAMRRWLAKLSEMSPVELRVFGCVALASGLLLCYIVQKTSLF